MRLPLMISPGNVEVAVEVAANEAAVHGLNALMKLYVIVPPSAVEPDPLIREPFPAVMEEFASIVFVTEPAGREMVEVAVREPTVRLPMEDEA